ncbi:MAG: hypothetical protein ABIO63_02190 [Casimicrobiaceae bacterium]
MKFIDLFKDSQKMTAVNRKHVRLYREIATRKLFITIIYVGLVLALLSAAYIASGGGQ